MARRPHSPERIVLTFPPDDDDPERIERSVVLPTGFPYMELLEIGKILHSEGVFVPGFQPPPVGPCHPEAFIFQANFEDIKTVVLPDRNIASRMAQIVAGVPMDAMLRKVAAIKAFCHFLDVLMEPSIAFHELAQVQGNEMANRELARFRDADNADPYPWLDLAFGDADALSPQASQRIPETIDMEFPLHRWRRNYVVSLKIAELECSGRPNLDRILSLVSWMRNDFIISGPAVLLACIYFAPNSPPRKGLFKQLRSPNRQRAIEGVRNAAWDLTHLSEMIRMVNEVHGSKIRYIFSSFDEGLRNLVKLLFETASDGFSEMRLTNALSAYWNRDNAGRIAKALAELMTEIHDEDRKHRRASSPESIDDMIRRGERLLLSTGQAS